MWKMRRRAVVLLACVATAARADQFRLEHVVAGGGASRAHSACFTLEATIGQPALGTLANGSYALDAGFWLAPVPPGDTLFQDGFENCSP